MPDFTYFVNSLKLSNKCQDKYSKRNTYKNSYLFFMSVKPNKNLLLGLFTLDELDLWLASGLLQRIYTAGAKTFHCSKHELRIKQEEDNKNIEKILSISCIFV